MTEASTAARRIAVYLAVTVALSSVFWFLIIREGHLAAKGGAYVFGLMWCPGVAALVASLATGRPLREIGWRWPRWRFLGLAWAIPLAYAAVAYGATWALGLGGVPNPAFVSWISTRYGSTGPAAVAAYLLVLATVGVLVSCVSGLGEEIGWRGFLVPELARTMPFHRVALLSGAIWSVWHYPILLFADYNAGTPAWFGLLCFTVMVVGIAFVFAWIRIESGSVWPAALLHGSHNLFVQGVFDRLTSDTGATKWIIGEFGAALALVAVAAGWLTWRRFARSPGALAPA